MNNLPEQEDDGMGEKKRSRRTSAERSLKMEEDIARISKDDSLLAREVVLMRKEISRIHYKVKRYQSQNRLLNIIFNSVIIILLVVIAFKLFETEIPHVNVK